MAGGAGAESPSRAPIRMSEGASLTTQSHQHYYDEDQRGGDRRNEHHVGPGGPEAARDRLRHAAVVEATHHGEVDTLPALQGAYEQGGDQGTGGGRLPEPVRRVTACLAGALHARDLSREHV